MLSSDENTQNYIMVTTSIVKFDSQAYRDQLYDSFCEFVDSFHYEYDAICQGSTGRWCNKHTGCMDSAK